MRRNAHQWAGHCYEACDATSDGPLIKMVEEIIADARLSALEEAAKVADQWTDPAYARLHAGEMTTPEVRTIVAVCMLIVRQIAALASPAKKDTP